MPNIAQLGRHHLAARIIAHHLEVLLAVLWRMALL